MKMPRQYFSSDHECFLSPSLYCIIHLSSTVLHFIIGDSEKIVKQKNAELSTCVIWPVEMAVEGRGNRPWVLGILIDEGAKLEGGGILTPFLLAPLQLSSQKKTILRYKSIGEGGGDFPLASPQVTSVELRVKYKIIYIATSFVYITSFYCERSKSEVIFVHNIKAYRE
jgi:hypothetical protein